MLADLANSLKADDDRKSDHTTLVQVKEEEVVTHTATTETNLRQGDLGVEVDSFFQRFNHASLQLRCGSEMTWRRSTRCSSGSLGAASGWR